MFSCVCSGTEGLVTGSTGYNLNAKLLTREQEHVLGTRIQTLMKFTSLGRHLSMSLGRQPSVGEWAEACGMTVEEFKVGAGLGDARRDRGDGRCRSLRFIALRES